MLMVRREGKLNDKNLHFFSTVLWSYLSFFHSLLKKQNSTWGLSSKFFTLKDHAISSIQLQNSLPYILLPIPNIHWLIGKVGVSFEDLETLYSDSILGD